MWSNLMMELLWVSLQPYGRCRCQSVEKYNNAQAEIAKIGLGKH